MVHSIFQNVNKTIGISIILECPIDILNVNHNNSMFANPFRTLNSSTKASQIGIWCSGPKSAPRSSKSTTFVQAFFQPSNLVKYLLKYRLEYLSNYLLKYILKYLLEILLEIPAEIHRSQIALICNKHPGAELHSVPTS